MQELAAEKAKAVASESKLKEQLVAREREITAVQARMQASYQDHVSETQQLQGKVGSGASRWILASGSLQRWRAGRPEAWGGGGDPVLLGSSVRAFLDRGAGVWEHPHETSCSWGPAVSVD